MDLFGGDKPWDPLDWTSSDDRVRGGSSHSELVCNPLEAIALFRGNLDIKTLGGAGFASQRTTGEDRKWNLEKYDGIVLDVERSEGKQYTLTLKDELLPKSPSGREQSTVSWEYDFKGPVDGGLVAFKWEDFKATYRGREKRHAAPLDLKNIKRVSLMMRSFFGTQEGDFELAVKSISVFQEDGEFEPYQDDPAAEAANPENEKFEDKASREGWFSWLFGFCAA